MFNEIQIAQAEYQLRNAKYNNHKEVEGFTVQVPNVIDRALMALRALLANRTPKPHQSRTVVSRSGAVAR